MSTPPPFRPPPSQDDPAPGEPPHIRIGTTEREAAYAALNVHLEAGRLDPEEYGDRYAAISVARTRPELLAPFHDLPEPHPLAAPSPPGPSWIDRAVNRSRGMRVNPAVFAVVPLVAIALGVITHVWLFFLLIPAAASLFGRRGFRGRGGPGCWGGGAGGRGYGGYSRPPGNNSSYDRGPYSGGGPAGGAGPYGGSN